LLSTAERTGSAIYNHFRIERKIGKNESQNPSQSDEVFDRPVIFENIQDFDQPFDF
jgi:hypothetical protein